MNCIPINYAEAIIEPFWDSGESYPDHEKYSRLNNYRITYTDGCLCTVGNSWTGNFVRIEKQPEGVYAVAMERECNIDVSGYDILRICVSMASNGRCRMSCRIDGTESVVAEFDGRNQKYEFDGAIKGRTLESVKLEFMKLNDEPTSVTLFWLGLANLRKQEEFRNAPSGFDTNWEGCFADEFEIEPTIGLYFDKDELIGLRKKMKEPQFAPIMDEMRRRAKESLSIVPEDYIGEFYTSGNVQVARCYEYGSIEFTHIMQDMAYVGIIDEDTELLKHACRIALSVCCNRSWEDNMMCTFPGSTWSRRSFVIAACAHSCSVVLDLAGSLLTWHGKNIIYNSLALKGLPRLEADFHMVEYIRHCNQGVDFSTGRIAALIALCSKYPRYEARLKEAQRDLFENLESYITEEGGCPEGPSYWTYTLSGSIPSMLMLSRHFGKTMKEIVPESIRRSENYAVACLTDSENFEFIPYNDAHYHGRYNLSVIMLFALVGKNNIWKHMYQKFFTPEAIGKMLSVGCSLVLAPEFTDVGECEYPEFITINDVGQTSVRFRDDKIGKVHLHMVSGVTYFAHAHQDKGSFVLEVNSKPIIIERGTGAYGSGLSLGGAQYHNLICPLTEDGTPFAQPRFGEGLGGKVIESKYENGVFTYETDLRDAWEKDVFKSCTRSAQMQSADILTLTDSFELAKDGKVMFLLNTHGAIECKSENEYTITDGDIVLTVTTDNWTGKCEGAGEFGVDDILDKVNRLCLVTEAKGKCELKTTIKISRK